MSNTHWLNTKRHPNITINTNIYTIGMLMILAMRSQHTGERGKQVQPLTEKRRMVT